MTRVIAVASGKGGVGKSNICLNLSLLMADRGARACLFDADLGLANINVLTGLYPERTLEDLVLHNTPLDDILLRSPDGVDIVPGSSGLEEMADLDGDRLAGMIRSLDTLESYDLLFLDCSSGITRQVVSFCLTSTEVVLVVTPEPTSLVDGFALVKVLDTNGLSHPVDVLINEVPDRNTARATYSRLKNAVSTRLTCGIRPLGMVLSDPNVEDAVRRQRPLVRLYPRSPAARCLDVVAERLTGRESGDEDASEGFWDRYFDILRRPLFLPTDQEASPSPMAAKADRKRPPPATSGRRIDALPVLPHTLLAAVRCMNQGEKVLPRIAELAGVDPGLALHLIAHGRPHAPPGPPVSLKAAAAAHGLGEAGVCGVVEQLAVRHVYDPPERAQLERLWSLVRKSAVCAALTRLIAERLYQFRGPEAYLAGLFLYMGSLVGSDKTGGPASRDDPVRTGVEFLKRQGLPSLFVDAIRYHRESTDRIVEALPLARAAHLAFRLTENPDAPPKETDPAISDWRTVRQRALENMDRILGIPLTGPNWRAAGSRLSREVRILVLEKTALRPLMEARDFKSAVRILENEMAESFNARQIMLFLHDEDRGRLRAQHHDRTYPAELLEQIAVPVDTGDSLILQCFNRRLPLFSSGHGPESRRSFADEQLMRLMGVEAMGCFPLCDSERSIGVMAVGCGADTASRLTAEHASLRRFIDRSTPHLVRLGGDEWAGMTTNSYSEETLFCETPAY